MKSFFQLEKHHTTISAEILAGITSFLTLSYTLAINPLVMQAAGLPFVGVFTATALASGICTIILGLYANVPFGMGPGMGINALVAQTVCLKMGYAWQEAICISFLAGLLHIFLVTGERGRNLVRQCLPENLKYAAVIGIGSFCTIGGFHYSGLLRHAESAAKNVAFDISGHASAMPLLFKFSYSKFVALLGIVVIAALLALEKKNKVSYAAFSLGILFSTFVGIPLGVTSLASLFAFDASPFLEYKGMFFAFMGDPGLLSLVSSPPPRLLLAGLVCVIVCLISVTDSVASITGLGSLVMNRIFTDQEVTGEADAPPRFRQAIAANSLGGPIGALLGCTTIICYVESCLGVASKGRTGLTAVVTGTLFLAAIPFVGFFHILPAEAVGAALIMCGGVILTLIRKIEWEHMEQSVPSGLAILLMVATNNFLSGLALGLVCHIIIHLILGRKDRLNTVMIVLGVLLAGATLALHLLQYSE